MRLKIFLLTLAVCSCALCKSNAQTTLYTHLDTLLKNAAVAKQDSNLVQIYDELASKYMEDDKNIPFDYINSLKYARLEFNLARKILWRKGLFLGAQSLGYVYQLNNNTSIAENWKKKEYEYATGELQPYTAIRDWLSLYYTQVSELRQEKQLEKIEEIYKSPISFLINRNDKKGLNLLYEEIAYLCLAEDDYNLAEKFGNKLQIFFNKDDRSQNHLEAIHFAAEMYSYNDLKESLKLLHTEELLASTANNLRLFKIYQLRGILYDRLKDYNEALKNYQLAYTLEPKNLIKKHNYNLDRIELNLARDYFFLKQDDKALKLNLQLLQNTSFANIKFFALSNMVDIYVGKKNYDLALATFKQYKEAYKKEIAANRIVIEGGNIDPEMLPALGIIYLNAPDSVIIKANIDPAERYEKAGKIFEYNLKHLNNSKNTYAKLEPYKNLSDYYTITKNYAAGLDTYKKYIALRDSINEAQNSAEFIKQDLHFNFSKKEDSTRFAQEIASSKLRNELNLNTAKQKLEQAQLKQNHISLIAAQERDRANMQQLKASQNASALADKTVQLQKTEIKDRRNQSYYLYGGIAALLIISFFIGKNYIDQRNSNNIISAEKQRSDNLLLNILPADVAEELKEKGSANARLFDEVTVLFTDFVNFTTISEMLTPQQLVDELDNSFKAFDSIMEKHVIEKIKTIGDAYLAVAGLPNADTNHAQNAVNAAMEITTFIKQRRQELGDKTFDVRVGIHSGSVVAGIVGVKKFAYDIWGDTVNTAARMEQSSEPGKINVSEKTYELVKDQFAFNYRGEIEAKNKGKLKMYFVDGIF